MSSISKILFRFIKSYGFLKASTLPVDDDFWLLYYPPKDAKVSGDAAVEKATDHANEYMSDIFQGNVGKEGAVFNSDHPYFEIGKKDPTWAIDNFELPSPESD